MMAVEKMPPVASLSDENGTKPVIINSQAPPVTRTSSRIKLKPAKIEHKLLLKMTDSSASSEVQQKTALTMKGLTLKNLDSALTVLKKFEIDPKTNNSLAPNDDKSNLRRYIILKQILNTDKVQKESVLVEFVKKEGWRMLSDWISRWWSDCLEVNQRVKNICDKSLVRLTDGQIRNQLKMDAKAMPGLNYALDLLKCCGKLPLQASHLTQQKKGATAVRRMSTEIEKELCPRFLRLLEPKLDPPTVNKLQTQIKTESSTIFSEWFKIVKEGKKQAIPEKTNAISKKNAKVEIKTDSSFLTTVNASTNILAEEAEARKKARKEEKRKKKEKMLEEAKKKENNEAKLLAEKNNAAKRKNSSTDSEYVPDPKSPKLDKNDTKIISEAEKSLDKKLIELGIGKSFGGDHHKKEKKRITWRDLVEVKMEDRNHLVDEFVFDLDPDERVNVNKLKLQGFSHEGDALRQSENTDFERDGYNLINTKRFNKDLGEEEIFDHVVPWMARLMPADQKSIHYKLIATNSKEVQIQAARQANSLGAFYGTFTPSTPDEPDIQNMSIKRTDKCRVIPLDTLDRKPGQSDVSPHFYDDNEEIEQIENTNIPEELLARNNNHFAPVKNLNKSNSMEELVPIVAPIVSGYDSIRHEVELENQLNQPVPELEALESSNLNNPVTANVLNLLQKFGESNNSSPSVSSPSGFHSRNRSGSPDLVVTSETPGLSSGKTSVFGQASIPNSEKPIIPALPTEFTGSKMSMINDVLNILKLKDLEESAALEKKEAAKIEREEVRNRPILGGIKGNDFEIKLPEPARNPNVGVHHDPYSKPPQVNKRENGDRNDRYERNSRYDQKTKYETVAKYESNPKYESRYNSNGRSSHSPENSRSKSPPNLNLTSVGRSGPPLAPPRNLNKIDPVAAGEAMMKMLASKTEPGSERKPVVETAYKRSNSQSHSRSPPDNRNSRRADNRDEHRSGNRPENRHEQRSNHQNDRNRLDDRPSYRGGGPIRGDRSSSDRLSGDRNSRDRNSGDRTTGDRNSGDRNNGDRNSGDRNSGDRNSGDRNDRPYDRENVRAGGGRDFKNSRERRDRSPDRRNDNRPYNRR